MARAAAETARVEAPAVAATQSAAGKYLELVSSVTVSVVVSSVAILDRSGMHINLLGTGVPPVTIEN